MVGGVHGFLSRRQFLQTAALSSAFGLPVTAAARGAQTSGYGLLLKGGHVIDPANHIDGITDVCADCGFTRPAGKEKLIARMTVHAGAIVFDDSAMSMVPWEQAPPQYFKSHRARADNFPRHVVRVEE